MDGKATTRAASTGTVAGPGSGERSKATWIGATFALVVPVLYSLLLASPLEGRLGPIPSALVGHALFWLCALIVLRDLRPAFVRRLGAESTRFSWPALLLAVGIGLGLSLLVPVLTVAAATFLPSTDGAGVVDIATSYPAWLLLISVITAAVTEEILFRGFPIERLRARNGTPLAGALLGLAAFVTVHAQGWQLTHVLGVVLPLGLALTAIYLWRRQLWFVMVVHLMVDLPLVVMSLLALAE